MASAAQMPYLATTSNFGTKIFGDIEAVEHSAGPQPLICLNPATPLKAATRPSNTSIWNTNSATKESPRITAEEVSTEILDFAGQTYAQVRFSAERLESVAN
jgi:hypothetical protein